ncbi:uncharacterized protein YjbJ (UPF0337 family) [Bradyrhizobium japonicum]
MDWNQVEGNWKQVKGKIKEQWGKLTDDDLDDRREARSTRRAKFRSDTAIRKTRRRKRSMIGTDVRLGEQLI